MTIQEVIHRLDSLHPNAFSVGEKIRWLSTAEGLIYNGVYAVHQNPPAPFEGFTPDTPLSTRLFVPEPYHWLYHHYLEGQMLYAGGDINGYNNAMALYNGIFREYWRFYHANHPSKATSLSVCG